MLSQVPIVLHAAEPERKLKLGLIGCGWYGMVDVKAALKVGGVEMVALCDVDSEHLSQSAAEVEKLQGKRPQTFKLYEDLLQAPGLEAVIIATPPHWHALQLIAALKRGLDVYCEKPLSYDVREGRAMVNAVKQSGRIVQIGFQRRQSPAFQAVRQHLQAGKAGRIVCAEANIHYTAGTQDPTPQPPPASLDWDLWCGPGPKIAYSPQVGHMNWRLEKTSGHGHLVDWGIHLIDAARVILGEGMPKAVAASGGLYYLKDKITTPDVLTAHFDFATCPLTWRHRIWGAEEYAPQISNGLFFYGEKETIFVTDDRWEVIPRGKNQERQVHEAKADAGVAHMAEFLKAVQSRQQPGCLAEDAYASTTTVKLAMIAYDTGCKISWDTQQESIVGNPAAAELLKRDYRQPWQHPFKG
ncbi:MAG TPA: Gfo/Idh/MocA family oxidoreductase [Bacillota bacterium]|nr:Gfo/Idh/MocA family oxidoreductase [Bacillota bacterium]